MQEPKFKAVEMHALAEIKISIEMQLGNTFQKPTDWQPAIYRTCSHTRRVSIRHKQGWAEFLFLFSFPILKLLFRLEPFQKKHCLFINMLALAKVRHNSDNLQWID